MFAVFVNLIKTIYIFLKTLYFIVDHYHATINILRKEKKMIWMKSLQFPKS